MEEERQEQVKIKRGRSMEDKRYAKIDETIRHTEGLGQDKLYLMPRLSQSYIRASVPGGRLLATG